MIEQSTKQSPTEGLIQAIFLSMYFLIILLSSRLQRLLNQCMLQSEDVMKSAQAAMNKEKPVFSKL